jgi:methylated-DNA-[protein]-cysteine S-methyltransferase
MNNARTRRPARTALATRCTAQCRIDTPLGPMTLVATQQGLAGAWFDGQAHHPGELAAPVQPSHPWLQQAAQELAGYFAGTRHTFDVPLDAMGTAFQHSVWQALCGIPSGQLHSYGALARQLGRPAASRAVGAAVGRNPLSVIVPCHRVVGGDGSLTGYAGGLQRKQALLALEGALGAPPGRADSRADSRAATLA